MKKWLIFALGILCFGLLAWAVTPEKPEEPEVYDLGITMTVEDLTPTGCTLKVTQSGGSPTGSVECGCDYFVEQLVEEKWTALETPENLCWTAEGYFLSKRTETFELNWEYIYGALPSGTYRIGKVILDWRAPGDYDSQDHYTEPFTIE